MKQLQSNLLTYAWSLLLSSHLHLKVTFSCPVIEHFIWIEPFLRGHLSYKATFSLSQRWPHNTGLTVCNRVWNRFKNGLKQDCRDYLNISFKNRCTYMSMGSLFKYPNMAISSFIYTYVISLIVRLNLFDKRGEGSTGIRFIYIFVYYIYETTVPVEGSYSVCTARWNI
jgi:hypothetical protein